MLVNSTIAKYLEIEHLYTVGNKNVYAISWKDNTPASFKDGSIKLGVYLEGNSIERAKPNATITLTATAR